MSNNILLQNYENAFNDVPVKNSVLGVETYQFKNVKQRRAMVSVNPTTAISSNILNSAQIDYRLENCIDRFSGGLACLLRVGYTNSSGANCSIAIAQAQLKQIQIYANNGSTLLYQTIDNQEAYCVDNLVMDFNEFNNISDLLLTDDNYSTGTVTIPNGQSGFWYVPIAPLFWKSIHFRPYCVESNFLIRLLFNTGAQNISSGTLTTTSAVLRISGYYESEQQKKMMLQSALTPKNFFYYGIQRHVESQTLNPSSTYTIRLSGIMGQCMCLFFTIRLSSNVASPGLQFSWIKAVSFEVLDQANVSLTGFDPVYTDEMRISYSHQVPNQFISNTNAHFHSFSQAPLDNCARGTSDGSEVFSGFHSLRFTTSSTLATNSYQITVIAFCNENLRLRNAVASSTRA